MTQYINNCGYHAAFETLNYLYDGELVEPTGTVPLNGEFITFDQREFSGTSMDGNVHILAMPGIQCNENPLEVNLIYILL